METQREFGVKELFTHVVGDMAKAVSERPGESRQQQDTRSQAAAHMVMGLQPRDVIEAMLAGHCMMFHELLVDSMRNTMRGEADPVRRATRAGIVTMNKAFDNCLSRLEYYQTRPSQGRRDAAEAGAPEETATGDPPRSPVAETWNAPAPAQTEETPPEIGPKAEAEASQATADFTASPEAIAACMANPEAMEALEACDPARFAIALGIGQPSEAYIAAASGQMSGRNGSASGNRRDLAGASGHKGRAGQSVRSTG
jgi:hypothetical protein